MASNNATVLVVDDEPGLADLYARWLETAYDVRTAYAGEAALDALDEAVDVVLLDRRMPGLSGDDVLDEIHRRGLECQVAMVTAVEPDFDILDLGFADYVVKPVDRTALHHVVENLLTLESYDDLIQRYYELVSKKVALETTRTDRELEENEQYGRLLEELERVAKRADRELDELFERGELSSTFGS